MLKLDMFSAKMLEQSKAVTKQHGNELYAYLVDKSDPEILLYDTGPNQPHVSLAGD